MLYFIISIIIFILFIFIVMARRGVAVYFLTHYKQAIGHGANERDALKEAINFFRYRKPFNQLTDEDVESFLDEILKAQNPSKAASILFQICESESNISMLKKEFIEKRQQMEEKNVMIIHIKDYNLKVNFSGDEKEEKIAEKLLNDLLRLDLIVAVEIDDVKKIIGEKTKKMIVYKSPIHQINFDVIKDMFLKSNRIIYGIYGNFKILDMKTINKIEKPIIESCSMYLGAPIPVERADDIIEIVALV